jgi:hypothetical protein
MHDLGGMPAGPIDHDGHDPSHAERRVDALMMLLMGHGVFNVDEMRRTIESLPPEMYERHDYYERWLYTLERLLIEKGVLTEAEIEARIEAQLDKMPGDG